MSAPGATECRSFQPMLDLDLELTPAMLKGQQSVFQCSWCGTVVVQPYPASTALGPCPACGTVRWWQQELPVAGLTRATGGASRADR